MQKEIISSRKPNIRRVMDRAPEYNGLLGSISEEFEGRMLHAYPKAGAIGRTSLR